MDPSPLLYAGAGLATPAAAMLPRLLDRAPISMPMLFLGAGALTFEVVEPLPDPDPHLHSTVSLQPARSVVAVHAEISPDRHAHRAEYARLAGFQQLTWYENGGDGGQPGLIDVNAIPLPPNALAYLCGPITFMRDMRAGLLNRGVHTDDIRYEVFGPGMLDN